MENRDKKEFFKNITVLGEAFGKDISESLIELYWETLKDLSIEDFRHSVKHLALTCKFFPKPVEFREPFEPDISAEAAIAYRKMEDAFISAGVYRTVIFDDPVIHAVADNLGGWVHYCNLTEGEVKWYRKEFEKHYANFAPMVARGQLTPPLSLGGLFALEDKSTDLAKSPVLIGDKQKALAWTDKAQKERALEDGNTKKLKETMPELLSVGSADRGVAETGTGDTGVFGRVLPGGKLKRAVE